jgi:hypothetical protein
MGMETTRVKDRKPERLSLRVTTDCRRLLLAIKARHGISEGSAVELGVRAYAAVNGISLPTQKGE